MMNPIYLSIIFLIIFISNTQKSLCADDIRYTNCSLPVYCGDQSIDINYPFWGVNRADYCGQPGFQIECQDGVSKINMMSNTFRILDINSTTRILKVARDDFWSSVCPTYLLNTTLDFIRFNYAPGQRNLTLYYGCTMRPDPGRGSYSVYPDCAVNGTSMDVFYVSRGSPVDALVECDSSVVVPVLETAAEELDQLRKTINVTLDEGFELQWNSGNDQCNTCVNSGGFCGYNSTESQFVCFCRDQPNAIECSSSPGPPDGEKKKAKTLTAVIGVVVASGVVAISLVCGCIVIVLRRRKNAAQYKSRDLQTLPSENDEIVEAFARYGGCLGPHRYSYSDVKKMTKSFSNKLGQGGYGNVYKGKLPDGRLVAVKVLKESTGNGEEFINEVASISRTSHVNIVTFLGFCYERKKRALIFKFMPNGSLDKFIYDQEPSGINGKLEWKTMYEIVVGIARGLEYLHRRCNVRIVHFDIKPHNILLDEDFCPKISDFGLAKQSKKKESIMSMLYARGTAGYIAPEVFCRNFGGVSHKSDVYSYGMMILEMVGARKNIDVRVSLSQNSEIYFPDPIYRQLESGNDINLEGVVTEEEQDMAKKMILVSLWCIQTNPSDRPSTTKALEMLEGSLENLPFPPKPSLSSPTRSPKHSSPTSSTTQVTSDEESSIS